VPFVALQQRAFSLVHVLEKSAQGSFFVNCAAAAAQSRVWMIDNIQIGNEYELPKHIAFGGNCLVVLPSRRRFVSTVA